MQFGLRVRDSPGQSKTLCVKFYCGARSKLQPSCSLSAPQQRDTVRMDMDSGGCGWLNLLKFSKPNFTFQLATCSSSSSFTICSNLHSVLFEHGMYPQVFVVEC